MKKIQIIFITFLLFCFSSCLSENHVFDTPGADFIPDSFNWEIITEEIKYANVSIPDFPLIYHVVQIDLKSSDIEICDYYENGINSDQAKLISHLNKKMKPIVLTNTSPFKYSNGLALKFFWMPSTYKNIGIHISNKTLKSMPVERYCALTFFQNEDESWRAEIFDNQMEIIEHNPDFAFGGFYTILRDYEILSFPANNYDSRSGCGISENGQKIFLLAVEGEKQNQSIGLSYPACAEIFLALGCKDAMQFDGGGTTCLFVGGRNKLSYRPFRKSPAFFGVREK